MRESYINNPGFSSRLKNELIIINKYVGALTDSAV